VSARLASSVESRLRQQVAAGRLESDAVQLDAGVRLDRLSASLLESSRSVGERLRAHLRRLPAPAERTLIEVGDLRLDLLSRRAYLGPVELALRPKEFDLLAVLSACPGKVHSREDLMANVWDEHWFGPTKTLDVHISSLRRKLTKGGEPAPCIETIRGRGYRFELPPAG